ncbi:MAG: flavin reductase family protein [Alphaproteobacteria bacterium]|nr:flavin reductase family protein [Alphaproteobacteria bacterium]
MQAPSTRAFRDALGCFATGVTIAATLARDGRPEGLTINSFASVSLDPPLVLFSLDRKARCLDSFQLAHGFAISVLRDDQVELSRAFAARGGPDWNAVAWSRWGQGSPVLRDALAALDCQVHARYDGGDHVILVGKVIKLQHGEGQPLLFYRGRYRRVDGT